MLFPARVVIRLLPLLPLTAVGGCDALWHDFLAQRSCTDDTACAGNQVCNTAAGRCEAASGDSGRGLCPVATICWENPLPQGNDLRGVWVESVDSVWAVGTQGLRMRYHAGRWTHAGLTSTVSLDAISGVREGGTTTIYAVGDGGLRTRYSGGRWADDLNGQGTNLSLHTVFALSSDVAFAGGDVGMVLRRSASGWEQVPTPAPGANVRAIWARDDHTVWATGDLGRLLYYTGSGMMADEASNPVNTQHLHAMWGDAASGVWSVGDAGITLRNIAGGWVTETHAGIVALHGVWGTSDGMAHWAAGRVNAELGQSYAYAGASAQWVASGGLTVGALRAVHGSGGNDVWMVGEKGAIQHWDGARWQLGTTGIQNDLRSVWGVDEKHIWAAGSGGVILFFDGDGWRAQDSGVIMDLFGVGGSGTSDVWAVGVGGTAVHWDGSRWEKISLGTTKPLNAVWAASAQDAWVSSQMGELFHWDGTRFGPSTVGTADLYGVWGTAPNDVWAVGSGSTALHYNGVAWSSVGVNQSNAANLRAVWGPNAATVYAVGEEQVLQYNSASGRFESLHREGGAQLQGVGGSATGTGNMWAVGSNSNESAGVLLHAAELPTQTPQFAQPILRSAWGGPSGQVWIVGDNGTILRYRPAR